MENQKLKQFTDWLDRLKPNHAVSGGTDGTAGQSAIFLAKEHDSSCPVQCPATRGTGQTLYVYRFRLRADKGGGAYLTPVPTLEQAEAELRRKYGDSLLLVVAERKTR